MQKYVIASRYSFVVLYRTRTRKVFFEQNFFVKKQKGLSNNRHARFKEGEKTDRVFLSGHERYMKMRKELHEIFGEELRLLAIGTRDGLDLTQKEMGNKLHMSESSYSDIETGKNHCSMVSAILLLEMQENPKVFLEHTKERMKIWYDRETKLV